MISLEELRKAARSDPKLFEVLVAKLAEDKQIFDKIAALSKSLGAVNDDVLMIFSDTIVAFSKAIYLNPDLKIHSSLSAYLCGIAKYKWMDLLKTRNKQPPSLELNDEGLDVVQDSALTLLLKGEQKEILFHLVDNLGVTCRDVLYHWAGGFNMKEVAEKMNYKSDGMARKKKHNCLQRLLKYIKDNPNVRDLLR